MSDYTVVQHSGFGYAGDEQFMQGLESRAITTKAEINRVRREGGRVFKSYTEAEDFAEQEMYQGIWQGMIPNARGKFSDKEIDGLRIYICN